MNRSIFFLTYQIKVPSGPLSYVIHSMKHYDYPVIDLTSIAYGSGIAAHSHRMATCEQHAGLSSNHPEQDSETGALAEVAFAVMANVPFDVYSGAGPDFHYNGYELDVKCSEQYANLAVMQRLLHEERIYVNFQRVSETAFQPIGWLWGSEVKERGELIKKTGRPAFYRVKSEKLRPFPKYLKK